MAELLLICNCEFLGKLGITFSKNLKSENGILSNRFCFLALAIHSRRPVS
jgi:hypothetical protein